MADTTRRGFVGGGLSAGALAATVPASALANIGAETATWPKAEAHGTLIAAARRNSPELRGLIEALFPTLKVAIRFWVPPLRATGATAGATAFGNAVSWDTATVWGEDFLFVTVSDAPVDIRIDDARAVAMTAVPGSPYWFHLARLALGQTHNYTYIAKSAPYGSFAVAGYGPDSYPQAGVTPGSLSEKRTVRSALYDGAESDYWVYANHGIDTVRGAPLMVWLDGAQHVGTASWRGMRLRIVTDNLVRQRRIPPMVHLLLQPGRGGPTQSLSYAGETQDHAVRSLQYDTVSDLFARHVIDEVLPEVARSVRLRTDAYSRGAMGLSSGAVAAFKLAWFRPDAFSRVMSAIGSFTALQWDAARGGRGGHDFPFLVRREPARNIRIWLSDGMNDIEVDMNGQADSFMGGSWPLANLQMAQALKTRFYDFHFRYGSAGHDWAQAALDLPEALTWLWRDYDPAKTDQVYEQEASERAKPLYRFGIVNRDAR